MHILMGDTIVKNPFKLAKSGNGNKKTYQKC